MAPKAKHKREEDDDLPVSKRQKAEPPIVTAQTPLETEISKWCFQDGSSDLAGLIGEYTHEHPAENVKNAEVVLSKATKIKTNARNKLQQSRAAFHLFELFSLPPVVATFLQTDKSKFNFNVTGSGFMDITRNKIPCNSGSTVHIPCFVEQKIGYRYMGFSKELPDVIEELIGGKLIVDYPLVYTEFDDLLRRVSAKHGVDYTILKSSFPDERYNLSIKQWNALTTKHGLTGDLVAFLAILSKIWRGPVYDSKCCYTHKDIIPERYVEDGDNTSDSGNETSLSERDE